MDSTNRSRIRLADYSTSEGKIVCRKTTLEESGSTSVEGKGLGKPLGVTYDEELGQWIVADSGNDRIVLLPLGRAITDRGNRNGRIRYPSAVSMLRHGENVVVLTITDIRIVAHGESQAPSVVITKIEGHARGVAVTGRGHVVTILYSVDGWNIHLYEGKENGALLSRTPYLTPTDLRIPPLSPVPWKPYVATRSQPCYMDFQRNTLVVTELGTNHLSSFFIYDDAIHNHGVTSLKTILGRRLRRGTDVFVDNDGKSVVADAAERRIHIFDQFGQYVNEVQLVDDDDKPLLPP